MNGYSGWVPPEWQFGAFDDDYFSNARHWIVSKGMSKGMCGCDLRTGSWSRIDARNASQYVLGTKVDFRKGGNAVRFEKQRVGGRLNQRVHQHWRSVSIGARSWSTAEHDLLLGVTGHAFCSASAAQYTETVLFNNTAIAEWQITSPIFRDGKRVRRGLVSSAVIHIEFVNADPKAPASSVCGDPRKLGFGAFPNGPKIERPLRRRVCVRIRSMAANPEL